MSVKVIKRFKERHQKFKLYNVGDTYSYNDEERVAFLVEQGFLEKDTAGEVEIKVMEDEKPKSKKKAEKENA